MTPSIQSPVLEIFDPAMCCSTGVCGPDVDPNLVQFSADVEWLKSQGIVVQRHNLAQEPAAFASNPIVKMALAEKGTQCLPLILFNHQTVSCGRYPTRKELSGFTNGAPGATYRPSTGRDPSEGCGCTPKSGCC